MKNLYLLPTDQPTGIFETNSGLQFSIMNKVRHGEFKGFHIYITSDEEIGEGDWYLDTTVNVIFKNDKLFLNGTGYKKIILSTDPELIADGIQAIDDEFLLWFVKNSNCEFVVIDWSPLSKNLYGWKIIIPKEEPKGEKKPHSFCETPEEKCTMNYCDDNGCQNRKRHLVEPHEQEILPEFTLSKNIFDKISDLPKGETLEEQRMYSEEEVYELLCHFFDDHVNAQNTNISQWFEQNKKK
jgi:hypothetical protein